MNYFVVGSHPWNKKIFDTRLRYFGGDWYYFDDFSALEYAYQDIHDGPEYIFFLHWSEKVPTYMVEEAKCICFHPSNLPYGRGGTPIQNLITAGFEETQLTAFRMTDEIDAGPIYLKKQLSLKGPLHKIFKREMRVAAEMVEYIIKNEPVPVPQEGEPTYFKRRTPGESLIRTTGIYNLYDFIRMLDAPGYPKAYTDDWGYHYEFSDAKILNDKIVARVEITCRK